MNILECHGRYAVRHESGEFPAFDDSSWEPVDDLLKPMIVTAAVSLSGQLDDCRDDEDLDDAARHGFSLLDAEVFTMAELNAEALRVFDELAKFQHACECN